MALFNTTSAVDIDECFESSFDMVTESYEMMAEIMEESYRLNSALYLTDAMLESKRAEGVSEASLEVLLEEAKKGFGTRIKDFFKMLWKRITDFFTKIKKFIKAIFNKKYRLELKRELYQAKIDKYKNKLANVEKLMGLAKDVAAENKKIAGLLTSGHSEAMKAIENGATGEEAKEILANKVTNGKTNDISEAKNVITVPVREKEKEAENLPVSTNETEAEENAKTAENTMGAIEVSATEVADENEKNAKAIVKQGEEAANKFENDPAKSAAAQNVTAAAVNMNNVLTQSFTQTLRNSLDRVLRAFKLSKAQRSAIKQLTYETEKQNKENSKALRPDIASWIPYLETYVIEGDDTPDLEDLDDDLDDTDESCGKKSLKEGASLLDQALGML